VYSANYKELARGSSKFLKFQESAAAASGTLLSKVCLPLGELRQCRYSWLRKEPPYPTSRPRLCKNMYRMLKNCMLTI